MFFIAIIYVYWGKWKEFSRLKAISTYTIIIAILVGSGYLFVRSTLTDIHYIINDTYCEEEVNLLSLDQRRSTGRGHNIYYYLGKRRLNVYQYRELKNIKDEFVLNLENFDQVVRRKEKYADLPPLQESDKRQILVSLNSSNDFIRTQTLRQLGLEIYIKVKIRYLPSSKQVLSYEVMGEVPK